MKIHYLNLDILNERCNGRDNKKKKTVYSRVSIVVSSKNNGPLKWRKNNVKDINLSGFLWPIGMK